jgi:hypothetical protein
MNRGRVGVDFYAMVKRVNNTMPLIIANESIGFLSLQSIVLDGDSDSEVSDGAVRGLGQTVGSVV